MQITIRKRTIGEGKQSLYLDFWPPVQKSEGGETRRESLGLYITTNPKTSFERRQNKDLAKMADGIYNSESDLYELPSVPSKWRMSNVMSLMAHDNTLSQDVRHDLNRFAFEMIQ